MTKLLTIKQAPEMLGIAVQTLNPRYTRQKPDH